MDAADRWPTFINRQAINTSGTIRTRKAKASSYSMKPVDIWVPHQAGYLSPGPIVQWLHQMLVKAALSEAQSQHILAEYVQIRVKGAPNLGSYVDNHVAVVKAEQLPPPQHGTPQCPCQSGPLSEFVDPAVGHVLIHDNSLLAKEVAQTSLHDGIGLNFRPLPQVCEGIDCRSLLDEVCDGLAATHISFPEDEPVPPDWIRQLRTAPLLPIKLPRGTWPARLRKSLVWRHNMGVRMAEAHQHLFVTCLDKASQAGCYMCIHWAASIIEERLTSASFEPLSQHEADEVLEQLNELYQQLGLPTVNEASWAYLYPTLKRHKCMAHERTQKHAASCGLAWRFISNCSAGTSSHLIGCLVSTIFSAVKVQSDAHRDSLSEEVYEQHGVRLRFRYSVTSWETVPLNLPAKVDAGDTLLTGDVKKAFENIPLGGPDGLHIPVEAYIREGYSWAARNRASKSLFIPLTLSGDTWEVSTIKPQFAVSSPPCFGNVSRWLEIPVHTAIEMAVAYIRMTIIRTGQFLVRQVLGVPMGGPPCSQLCDIYLDYYEFWLAMRIWAALNSDETALQAMGRKLATLMLLFFRYADDIFAVTRHDFCSLLLDPAAPRSGEVLLWLYPLREADGTTILDFENEPVVEDEHGIISVDFLCMTITLSKACNIKGKAGRKCRYLHYKPYNAKDKFTFEFPTLTQWDSYTPTSVLRASISTMVPYAIIGSSTLGAAETFMENVILKLIKNGFRKAVLMNMWEEAVTNLIPGLPCREPLASDIPQFTEHIRLYIGRDLWKLQ